MGDRGPKSRPNHLKALDGVWEGRINRDEPLPAEAQIVPPVELDDAARSIWDRLAPDLIAKKVLTPWDVDAFAKACRLQALLNRALSDAESEPLVAGGYEGNPVVNPTIRVVTALESSLRSVWSRFGLTPSDRAELKVDHGNGSRSGVESYLA